MRITKKDLLDFLKDVPDDSVFAIRCKGLDDGDVLFYDVKCNVSTVRGKSIFYVISDGLDMSIEGEKEMLKEELSPF